MIPSALTDCIQWVTWRNEQGTKVPYRALSNRKASSTDPQSWATFEQATEAANRRADAGIGFVFTADDPYTGIDLDDCIDDAGQVAPWAQALITELDSYSEISPSGHGIKVWVEGTIPSAVKVPYYDGGIEMYTERRFFTVTAQQLAGTPDTIRQAQETLDRLYAALRPAAPEITPSEPSPPPLHTQPADRAYLEEWARRKITFAVTEVANATDGFKHEKRLDMARLLGGLIPHGLATESQIEAALYGANPPKTEAQRNERKVIRDGIRYGVAAPLELPPPPAQPVFDAAGVAYCPIHQTRLPKAKNGNGYKCHQRDTSEPSGYCGYWWKGEGYVEPAPPPNTAQAAPGSAPSATSYHTAPSAPMDINDLLEMERKPTIWYAPGFLREGLGLLVGQPNVGKTPLLAQLAIAIANGNKWMGAVQTQQANVLYLGVEYSAQELIPLFERSRCGQTIPRGRLLIRTIEDSFPTTPEEAIAELEHYITAYGVKVIIIDVLTAFLPPEKFKQNVYRGDYSELKPYHKLALQYTAAILGSWHGSKRESDPKIMYNGSTGMWAAAASRITLYQDQDQRVRIASFPRMADKIDWALAQERTLTGHRWIVSDASPEPVCNPTELQIFRILKEHASQATPLGPATLAELTGLPVNTAKTATRRMFEKNLIQQAGKYGGYYIEESATIETSETLETIVTPATSETIETSETFQSDLNTGSIDSDDSKRFQRFQKVSSNSENSMASGSAKPHKVSKVSAITHDQSNDVAEITRNHPDLTHSDAANGDHGAEGDYMITDSETPPEPSISDLAGIPADYVPTPDTAAMIARLRARTNKEAA